VDLEQESKETLATWVLVQIYTQSSFFMPVKAVCLSLFQFVTLHVTCVVLLLMYIR
jgi:hypothetical protein